MGTKPTCPKCGGEVVKYGKMMRKEGYVQRYRCKKCMFIFH